VVLEDGVVPRLVERVIARELTEDALALDRVERVAIAILSET